VNIFHKFVHIEKFQNWYWRLDNSWFVRLTGINTDTRIDKRVLDMDFQPVYTPLFSIEKIPGQLIITTYWWRETCTTYVLQARKPYYLSFRAAVEEYIDT
jgi:hypothetical protein